MILNFTMKNYMSFCDVQQFSMNRGAAYSHEEGWVHPDVSAVTGIIGPNASGKSNLLDGLAFVSKFVRTSYRKGDKSTKIPVEPFLLDCASSRLPSEFLVEFVAKDSLRYVFSFAVTRAEVIYEELLVYRTRQPSLLYSREVSDGRQTISFGSSLKGAKQQMWSMTRKNALFLSVAAAAGSKQLAFAYEGLVDGIGLYDAAGYTGELMNIKQLARNDPDKLAALSELVSFADVGVTAIDVRKKAAPSKDESSRAEEEFLSSISGIDESDLNELRWLFSTDLFFCHTGKDGEAWLSSAQESDGTIASLAFFSMALRALQDGLTLLVDGMGRDLHPVMLRECVRLFADHRTNSNQAQLIFTTHDVSLIEGTSFDDHVLDRDQIWLCEKDTDGVSHMCPLTDYSPRKDENLRKNYLNGIYHALPDPAFHERIADMMERH